MTNIYKTYEYSFEVAQDDRTTNETFIATVWENGDAEIVVQSNAGDTVYTRRTHWSTPKMAHDWTYGAMILRYA